MVRMSGHLVAIAGMSYLDRTPNPLGDRATFYNYKSSPYAAENEGTIHDTGPCASLVGNSSLNKALRSFKMKSVSDDAPYRDRHLFGGNSEPHLAVCVVKFPSECSDESGNSVARVEILF